MTVILFIFSLFLLTFSLTPLLPWQSALIDLPSHFVLQYFVAGLFLLLLCFFIRGGGIAAPLVVLSLLLNAAHLAPYFLPGVPKVADGARLALLEANVLRFNDEPGALHDLITTQKPDIVVVLELNPAFAGMLAGLSDEYPHQKLVARENSSFGIGVISRLPLQNMTEETLYNVNIPSLHFSVKLGAEKIDIAALHAANPLDDLAARDGEFDALVKKRGGLSSSHFVVTGDLNATPYCMAFKRFVRALDLRSTQEGLGIFGTFHSGLPTTLLRLPIDHVLIGRGLAVEKHVIGSDINSDHLPVLTILGLAAQKADLNQN